jgi:hypothetical protein
VRRYLVALLLAFPVLADQPSIEWTRLGYIVVHTDSGEYISRHIDAEKAYQSALAHAYASGNTGDFVYRISFPKRLMEIHIPEIVSVMLPPPEPPEPPPEDPGEEIEQGTVFVCNGTGAGGTSFEPAGIPGNDGFSMETPLPILHTTKGFAPGTDVRFCEGAIWENHELQVEHSGDAGDNNRLAIKGLQLGLLSRNAYKSMYDVSAANPAVIGCYFNMNGIARPCFNTVAYCDHDRGKQECYDGS